MRARAWLVVIAPSLLAACVPTDFSDLRGEAQVRALEAPPGYPKSTFGLVVTGWSGTIDGQFSSRVATSAGADSPFLAYSLLDGDRIRLDGPRFDGCNSDIPCLPGSGGSLVGLPAWADREMCLAVAATESGEIKMRCEDDAATRSVIVPGPGGERFGFAGAALRGSHPFGRAVYGAPGANGGLGAVYRLPDGSAPVPIDFSGGAGAGRELGRAVAVGVLDESTALVAAAAPLGADKRVVVVSATVAEDGTVSSAVRACLDETTAGWGQALAIGDLSADGAPELVVGSGPGDGRLSAVRIYDGAALPAEGSCEDAWPVAAELGCPERPDVTCDATSELGVAVAIGDLDGDGVGDLLVGAPRADVEGEIDAGAVFAFRGGDLGTLGQDDRVVELRHSSPQTGAGLGRAVAVAAGLDDDSGVRRDEPVVGAPGVESVYVFLCSGLEGDSPATTGAAPCQPREP